MTRFEKLNIWLQILTLLILVGALHFSYNANSTADKTLRAAYVPWVHVIEPKLHVEGEKLRMVFKVENGSNAPAIGLYVEGNVEGISAPAPVGTNSREYDQSLVLPNSKKEYGLFVSIKDRNSTLVYEDFLAGRISFQFKVTYQDAFKNEYHLIQTFKYREGDLHPIHTEVQGLEILK